MGKNLTPQQERSGLARPIGRLKDSHSAHGVRMGKQAFSSFVEQSRKNSPKPYDQQDMNLMSKVKLDSDI